MRADLAISHDEVYLATQTGLNMNEHSLESATTVIGEFASAFSNAGFAKWVMPCKIVLLLGKFRKFSNWVVNVRVIYCEYL
jgi:hypothetical protein